MYMRFDIAPCVCVCLFKYIWAQWIWFLFPFIYLCASVCLAFNTKNLNSFNCHLKRIFHSKSVWMAGKLIFWKPPNDIPLKMCCYFCAGKNSHSTIIHRNNLLKEHQVFGIRRVERYQIMETLAFPIDFLKYQQLVENSNKSYTKDFKTLSYMKKTHDPLEMCVCGMKWTHLMLKKQIKWKFCFRTTTNKTSRL